MPLGSMVNASFVSFVEIVADVSFRPSVRSRAEIRPVSPSRRISALAVDVVEGLSDGENVLLPKAILRLTTG